MQKSHPVIDNPLFVKEFSRQNDPFFPSEVSFWATASEAQRAAAIRENPDLWRTGQGKNFLEALSKVRSINARNKYWLPIFEKEMKDLGDYDRLKKVNACLLTYKDRSEEYATTEVERIPQWQE
jgi:hypothetical protein